MAESSLIRREGPLWFAALVIAFIIWLMAKMSTLESSELIVPIIVENAPPNVEIEVNPRSAKVIVNFPQSQKDRAVSQNIEIRVDLREVFRLDPTQWAGVGEPKVHDVAIGKDNLHTINLPQSVQVTDLRLSKIQIFARLITRPVQVHPQVVGQLPENYELRGEPKSEPAEVIVTAPVETLRKLSEPGFELLTDQIRLDGRTQDFIDYPNVQLPRGVQLVDENHAKVQVMIGVREKEITRVIQDVPIEILVFAVDVRAVVKPSTANVTVKGRVSMIERVDPLMFRFAPRKAISETVGPSKPVDLDISFDESAPEQIRREVTIEDFSPKQVDLEYVKAPEGEDKDKR